MSDYFDRIERQLVRGVEARGAHRRGHWAARLAPVAATLVVVAVVAVFLGVRGRSRPPAGTAAGGGVVFVSSAPAAVLDRAAGILHLRLGAMFSDVHVTRTGHDLVASAGGASRAQIEALAVPGRLAMYDWEANVLTPSGQTVASQLRSQTPSAIEISQGSGAASPGGAGGGGLPLYQAVSLAARRGHAPSAQYYLFGCGPRHCLIGGPATTPTQLPAGVRGQALTVPRGVVVLEAAAPSFGRAPAVSDPAARFFALRDAAALTGTEITGVHAARDASGQPDVQFGFTSGGARAFHAVTSAVAHRGAVVSGTGLTLNQHFAIALDDRLVTVPSIDFKAYPDGITGSDGADIEAGFTSRSAREFATLLRYGPLPVNLRPQSR